MLAVICSNPLKPRQLGSPSEYRRSKLPKTRITITRFTCHGSMRIASDRADHRKRSAAREKTRPLLCRGGRVSCRAAPRRRGYKGRWQPRTGSDTLSLKGYYEYCRAVFPVDTGPYSSSRVFLGAPRCHRRRAAVYGEPRGRKKRRARVRTQKRLGGR